MVVVRRPLQDGYRSRSARTCIGGGAPSTRGGRKTFSRGAASAPPGALVQLGFRAKTRPGLGALGQGPLVCPGIFTDVSDKFVQGSWDKGGTKGIGLHWRELRPSARALEVRFSKVREKQASARMGSRAVAPYANYGASRSPAVTRLARRLVPQWLPPKKDRARARTLVCPARSPTAFRVESDGLRPRPLRNSPRGDTY